MAFSEAQVKNLEAKLDAKHVRTRQVQDTTLAHVEGWHVIAEANRIFGYDAWDRQMRLVTLGVAPPRRVLYRQGPHRRQGRPGGDHARRLWEQERQGFNPRRST